MAAVIAAIGAAFLAGAIALFREHRQQQRQLLVAARVMDSTFGMVDAGISTSLDSNRWVPFNILPGEDSFTKAWETHKGDLAGHLTWNEWLDVLRAVNFYFVLAGADQSETPREARAELDETSAVLEEGMKVLRPYCTDRLSVWKLVHRRMRARNDS